MHSDSHTRLERHRRAASPSFMSDNALQDWTGRACQVVQRRAGCCFKDGVEEKKQTRRMTWRSSTAHTKKTQKDIWDLLRCGEQISHV